MRVAFVNPVGQVGGAELNLLDLMSSLPDAMPDIERHLIVASDGPLIERAESIGVRVHVLPLPESIAALGDSAFRGRGPLRAVLGLAARGVPVGLDLKRYAKQLAAKLQAIDPDLVHSNGIKTHVVLRLAGVGRALLVWQVQDFLGERPLISRSLRWATRGVSRVLAISEAVGHDARLVLPGVSVSVIYPAIDTTSFSPGGVEASRLDTLAGLEPAAEGVVRVGLVAAYARWKGQDLFLRAIARLPRDLPCRAYVVGGPIYKTRGSQFSMEELAALADSLGVADRVGFVPFQPDTADVYRALDVVVHASTRPEPFGRTIVEAMACGRATIVAGAGGAVELFTDGLDAVGFAPGDVEALASAISGLVRDPDRRVRLGEAGRRTAVERFARGRLGLEVARLYGELTREHALSR